MYKILSEYLPAKFPKSFKLLVSKYIPAEDYIGRNLFDFFDERGIHIETRWIPGDEFYWDGAEAEERQKNGWFVKSFYECRIYVEFSKIVTESKFTSSPCKTRGEAEEEAFLRAFEILENRV